MLSRDGLERHLEGNTVPVACMFAADFLLLSEELREGNMDVFFVTGNKTPVRGPTLLSGVSDFIMENHGPPVSFVEGYDDRFLVTKEAMSEWLASPQNQQFKASMTEESVSDAESDGLDSNQR